MPDPSFPAAVPWDDRPNNTVSVAASLINSSRAQVYVLAKNGQLDMVKLAGRTLVTTESLRRFLATAVPYRPDGTNPRGLAKTRAAELAQRAA